MRLLVPQPNDENKWKSRLADDLNTLLGRAQYFLETSNDASDKEAAEATFRVVDRVVEFEELEAEEE
jgi:hypothetical protein